MPLWLHLFGCTMNSMDTPTEGLPDSRIRVEIAKLMADTVKLAAEQRRLDALDARRTPARWWYSAIALGAAGGVGAAVFVVLSKLVAG